MLQFFSNLADFIGILAFAFSGLLAGKERRLDPVGIFVLAFTTAFGGGILRDVVINNRPFWFITHEYYVWLTLLLTVFAPVLVKRFHHDIPYAAFIWLDAIGLGFFSASGTALASSFGVPMLSSTLLGVTTGAAGGMLRDVFMNKLPMVLSDRKPYASAAFLGSWLTLGLIYGGVNSVAAVWIGSLFICGVRMITWYADWEIAYNSMGVVIAQSRLVQAIFKAGPSKRRRKSSNRDTFPPENE